MKPSDRGVPPTTRSQTLAGGPVRAPKGAEISCQGWHQEAALRMLMNSFDPAVSEALDEALGPYRSSEWLQSLAESLRRLGNEKTLLLRSGGAGAGVGIVRTQEAAPRALIVNSSPACQAQFGEGDKLGLILFGQAAAGSWTSIGRQSAVQATYETFAAAARKHFDGSLAGKFVISGGLGSMGGAQPLAAMLNGAAFLGIEANPDRITGLIREGWCDYCVNSLDEALRILKVAVRQKNAVSVGLIGNCAEVVPELARRGIQPDLLTDQTGAHDPGNGYIPAGLTLASALELRRLHPKDCLRRAVESVARQVDAMLKIQKMGAITFEFGNGLLAAAFGQGVTDAFKIPSFMTAYIRPLICEARAPVRWVALSGDGADIHRIDDAAIEIFSGDRNLTEWIQQAKKRIKFRGLPARSAWLRRKQGAALGDRINRMMAEGRLKAPVVMARDAIDCAFLNGPEMEDMKAPSYYHVEDWPLLAALLDTASGASWVEITAGSGPSACAHSACAVVADGTPQAGARIQRVMVW